MGLFDCRILRLERRGVDDGCEVDLGLVPIYHNHDQSLLYLLQGR